MNVRQLIDVPVGMRDKVFLSTDIRCPAGRGPFPTLVYRTPYNNQGFAIDDPYLASGYALVKQDCRGRFDSEGVFDPFHEAADGADTLAWVAAQPWCDGRIGLIGNSYCATTQLNAAWTRPAGLRAMTPGVMGCDLFKDLIYFNGVFNLSLAFAWGAAVAGRTVQGLETTDLQAVFRHLPLNTMDEAAGFRLSYLHDWLAHPVYDDYWAQVSIEQHYPHFDVPGLHAGGWYDFYAEGVVRNFCGIRELGGAQARRAQKLIMGPWVHGLGGQAIGAMDFGEAASVQMEPIYKRWIDRWVKGEDNGIDREPPVRIFIMGSNIWRDESEWPLARTVETPYFLMSEGGANTQGGDGRLQGRFRGGAACDHFIYDPADPVPTVGGNGYAVPSGPTDHAEIERRPDVLVYTGEPLEQPLEITGFVRAVLYASSDAPDTDFVLRLCDLYPDGRSIILCDGIVRARFREGLDKEVFMNPGTVYEFQVPLGVTSNVFLPGHRIRLEVTSSCFPRFARNLNTGESASCGVRMQVARQTLWHSVPQPSRLILPIIPQ
jgi:putative CocE/NonD family hydrolase